MQYNQYENIDQIFIPVTRYQKQYRLKSLIEENAGKRVLVFVKTKRMADFLAVWLSEQQMLTTSIHGDRLQCERDLAKWNFKSHHRRILVATAVAVCGVDVQNVDLVVNYDLPNTITEYAHRIRRTGRVGNRGKAVSFVDADQDAGLLSDFLRLLHNYN